MSDSSLAALFKNRTTPAFVAYIAAGDPDLAGTELFVGALVRAGTDILELGVPFSDPVADGPTNQRAAERALKSGTTLRKILNFVAELRRDGIKTPIVLFTYSNPVFAMGLETFARSAASSGIDGVLMLDLPPEEATEYLALMRSAKIDTVFLAAPTSDESRLTRVDAVSTGFVYYVSRTGVTGARTDLPTDLAEEIARVKRRVRNPLAVGFGISSPEQARQVAGAGADAVVVGSAIVQIIEQNPVAQQAAAKIEKFVKGLVEGIQRPL